MLARNPVSLISLIAWSTACGGVRRGWLPVAGGPHFLGGVAELCRVEEFAARHFRRSGFEAIFSKARHFTCCLVCISGR